MRRTRLADCRGCQVTANVKDWRWCDGCRAWVFDWWLLRVGRRALCGACFVEWNRGPEDRAEAQAAARYLEKDYGGGV